MQLYLFFLIFIALIFTVYLYIDIKERENLEKITKPGDFLETGGFFQKDSQENFPDSLYQGGKSTSISYLNLEEPSYTDDNSRFGGTQLSSNQAIVIKGIHKFKYLSFTILDDKHSKLGTLVPKEGKPFALVILRSKTIQKNFERLLKDYEQSFIIIGDSYPFSSRVSVVAEKIFDNDNTLTKLYSKKFTFISIYPQLTVEVENIVENQVETKISEDMFNDFWKSKFSRNHSIEKDIDLHPVEHNLGYSLRYVSDLTDFNPSTLVNLVTTKSCSEQVQLGIIDECNRVILSTELGKYNDESKSHDDEIIVQVELLPKLTGKYRIMSCHFSHEPVLKPKIISLSGTKYGK